MSDMFSNEEKEEVSDEEMELFALGIVPGRYKGFRKAHPKKKVFYNNKITKFAFQWYIDNCGVKELEAIREEKLPDGFDKLLAKKFTEEVAKEPEEQKEEDLTEKEKNIITGYIEQAKKLVAQIETQKGSINRVLMKSEKYFEWFSFLYGFMSDKMMIKPGMKVEEEEMEMVDAIAEVLEE